VRRVCFFSFASVPSGDGSDPGPALLDGGGAPAPAAAEAEVAGGAPPSVVPGDGLSSRVTFSFAASSSFTVTTPLARPSPIAWSLCSPGSTGRATPISAGGTVMPSIVTWNFGGGDARSIWSVGMRFSTSGSSFFASFCALTKAAGAVAGRVSLISFMYVSRDFTTFPSFA
jgi:hypothetical protein